VSAMLGLLFSAVYRSACGSVALY